MPAPAALPNRSLPSAGLTLALAVMIAAAFWNLSSVDMDTFLLPWFAHIRQTGPIAAFASSFSNYTPPYLYLLALASPLAAVWPPFIVIKLVSLAGHLVLAFAVKRLLTTLRHPQPLAAAGLIALAPTLLLNATLLTQCDAYWAAALVMAIAAAVERRHAAMFAWCGLAVAFKAQAAFIGPFFFALAIARTIPLRFWLMAPAATVAAMLPAWLAGWPAQDLLTIYMRQAQWESLLALNAPNVWMIAQTLAGADSAALSALATALALVASATYVAFYAGRLRTADPLALVRAATLCALIVPGLLPRMHERYFFLSDVLALSIVAMRPNLWKLGLLTQLGSGLAIFGYLTGAPVLAVWGALTMLGATGLMVRPAGGPVRPSLAASAQA